MTMTSTELRAWRFRHGFTQARCAELFGMSWRGWNRRESGKIKITRETEMACLYIDDHPPENKEPTP